MPAQSEMMPGSVDLLVLSVILMIVTFPRSALTAANAVQLIRFLVISQPE
ncbi:hypothetical protein Pan241w_55390 [Gimesia alba]|uniref:Uncharacterized protein n=1 Tax=Gimesia alba TaxID=2527973 RepID=A0A517RNH1_9PLAN|nr:hypothetical protein [Gimesia alba]QDT45419.1 hypothetical protein Pan241w_55390 [Gimesia alba]